MSLRGKKEQYLLSHIVKWYMFRRELNFSEKMTKYSWTAAIDLHWNDALRGWNLCELFMLQPDHPTAFCRERKRRADTWSRNVCFAMQAFLCSYLPSKIGQTGPAHLDNTLSDSVFWFLVNVFKSFSPSAGCKKKYFDLFHYHRKWNFVLSLTLPPPPPHTHTHTRARTNTLCKGRGSFLFSFLF